ncbi:calpastatin isoform 8-T8 [Dugong dugon]
MSQPGQKPSASPRPRRAAASRPTKEHVSEKTGGSPSKPEEKKGADEKKAASVGSSQPSRTHASGTAPTSKVSASSAATSKSSSMNPTETKIEGPLSPIKKRHKKQAVKTEPEKKSQSTKPSVVHEKKTQEKKPKEHREPKSSPKHTTDTGSKHAHDKKAVPRSSEQLTTEKSTELKTTSQVAVSAGGKSVVAGVTATSGKPDDKKKEKKPLAAAVPVESKPSKPSGKSDMDAALDDLIDTLGAPEVTEEDDTTYTGPEVSDPMSFTYIEELGKREVTLPPKYRELLAKNEGIIQPPADSVKPMGPDDAIDALSSDFTFSSPTTGKKNTEKEKSTGEVLKAQSVGVIRSAAPPHEKKRRVEEDTMSDQALDALSASLGTWEPEPELDLSSIKEVDEAKAKEEKVKKCGEEEETIPPKFRLKPAMDKEGKPLLPEPEEKSKPMSESELIDELLEDFDQSKSKEKPSKPTEKVEECKAPAPTPEGDTVLRTSLCSIQSAPPKPATSKGVVPDDAVEALADSLGRKEADPEDGKPVVDKIKDKDGKPLPPKEPKEQFPKFEDARLSAVISEVVSQTPASTTHSAGPPPKALESDNKELDDALDKLSDSLGQRQPDPDENKPMEDKVKEKATAEHKDKLGERDDTIPPKYIHLLDDDDQGKPEAPSTKKPKESKKPADDRDPIDTLSGDFDSCPSTTETSQKAAKDKDKKTDSSTKAPKNGGKSKESAKAKEEASKPKADERNTS